MRRTVQDRSDGALGAPQWHDVTVDERSAVSFADRHTPERWAWTLVWLGLITGGVNVWGFWWSSAGVVVVAALMVIGGVAGTVATWVVPYPRALVLPWLAQAGALACVVLPQAIIIHTSASYHTDSAAFDDVSAHALLHGRDPYTTSMSAAAQLLRQPDRYWTYTVSGGHVAHASYPAGSFLVDMPALALGLHHQVVDWVDLAAWVVTAILLFLLVPRSLRWLASLVTITPIFIGMFGNSGTDAAFLPFLVLAVWRWDQYGRPGAGAVRFMGPLWLGLACSVKQLPWFCVPVLAAGVYLETRADGRRPLAVAARYAGTVAATFAAVNLPFAVWHFGPWLHGTFTPFVDSLVADGQGIVSLATHGVTGGVDLTLLTVAGAFAYAGVVCAFIVFYSPLKRVWPLLLPLAFFFSARSLSSYLVDLFPVAVVALSTVPPSFARAGEATRARRGAPARGLEAMGAIERRHPGRWWAPGVLAVAGLGGLVAVTTALAFTGAPLALVLRNVQSSHAGHRIESITVQVHNRTTGTVTPHFLVNTGSNPNGFWLPRDGRAPVVGPGATTTVTLLPPPGTGTPQKGAHWLVEAYTGRKLSTSAPQVWRSP